MECDYHNKLIKICGLITEKIMGCNIPWNVIQYWFGDESYFDDIYENAFTEILGAPLTDTQKALFRKKGLNLEKAIQTWFARNPNLTEDCLYYKLPIYIEKQMKKPDMRDYFGEPC